MHISIFLVFFAEDPSGKVTKSTMSEQTLLELMTADMNHFRQLQAHRGVLPDRWVNVTYHPDATVKSICWIFEYDTDVEDDDETVMEQGGSIDLQWLPLTIESLTLSDMHLRGTVDTRTLPESLCEVIIDENCLKGPFYTAGVPKGMTFLNISFNEFEGSLDLSQLPPKLISFSATSNQLSGALDLRNLPLELCRLYLNVNRFSGEIDLQSLPPKLWTLDLSKNLLGQKELVVNEIIYMRRQIVVDSFRFERITIPDGTAQSILVMGPITRIQYRNHN